MTQLVGWPTIIEHDDTFYGERCRYEINLRTSNKAGHAKHRGEWFHRWAWKELFGPIPKGLVVRHSCDNGMCATPAHWRLGTSKDNAVDAAMKGQLARKLTEDDVHEIRRRIERGELQKDIAVDYGVDKTLISQIHRRKIWKWLS